MGGVERRRRAARLAELSRLRAHVERRIARQGGFRGPVRRHQQQLSAELDRIEAEFQRLWSRAA